MNQLRTISFFLASLCLFSCQNSNELEEYYFPVDSFKNPVTYCFINDDGHEQFWRMTYVDSRKHLITEMYNGKFELTDSIVESISGSSADIQAFYSKHNGSLDKVDVKKSRVFNFDSKLEDSFGWEIVFHHDESDMILEKTRELIDNNYLIEFGGETKKGVIFKETYTTTFKGSTINDQSSYIQYSSYIQGVGAFSWGGEQDINHGKHYRLVNILDESEWNRIKSIQ